MDPGFHCPTATISDRLALTARDIKLSHSVFALPFALLATFLAADAADVCRMAETEGLTAHAASIEIRLADPPAGESP